MHEKARVRVIVDSGESKASVQENEDTQRDLSSKSVPMGTKRMNRVVQQLRRAVLLRDGAGLSDGQLLGWFVERRDETAFAALVRRHGPMVWGVCRRVLDHHQDAEDAFQATFLVLIRKAATVMPREMVANWLYGVARQTSLKARAMASRRRVRERHMPRMPEPVAAQQDLWSDLRPLLDQELSRLPDKYRVVIVLCDLEGNTRKEAARHLGLPEGTLSAQLAREADLDLQTTTVDKASGEFTLMHGMAGNGYFHLVLASPERYSQPFANVYFGTGDNVLRKKTW